MSSPVLKRGELTGAILALTITTGVCALAVLMPGLARLLPTFSRRKTYIQKRDLRRSLKRLQNLGLISAYAGAGGKEFVRLTKKGEEFVALYELRKGPLVKPRRWDKTWRVVVFDVSEKYRHKRDRLRQLLKSTGFVRLQDSTWIYPYECEEIIELIKTALRVRFECIYLTCKRFPSDRWLCRHFSLTKYIKK